MQLSKLCWGWITLNGYTRMAIKMKKKNQTSKAVGQRQAYGKWLISLREKRWRRQRKSIAKACLSEVFDIHREQSNWLSKLMAKNLRHNPSCKINSYHLPDFHKKKYQVHTHQPLVILDFLNERSNGLLWMNYQVSSMNPGTFHFYIKPPIDKAESTSVHLPNHYTSLHIDGKQPLHLAPDVVHNWIPIQ